MVHTAPNIHRHVPLISDSNFSILYIHRFVMFIWIYLLESKFCDTAFEELGYNIIMAVVYIFCYFNLIDNHTRLRYFIFYIIILFEDLLLIFICYMSSHTHHKWYHYPAIFGVIAGYMIGILFQIIYYLFFHPNGSTLECSYHDTSDKDNRIKCCLTWSQLLNKEKSNESAHTNNNFSNS